MDPKDEEYMDFKEFMNEICSFTITLNDQNELARCEVDKWPDHTEIRNDPRSVKLTFHPTHLTLVDFDHVKIKVHIETKNPQDAPVSIMLLSLDRHLSFQKPVIPQWRKASREEVDELRAPITIGYLESEPQPLAVSFPGIDTQAP
jgi:hypothetical protein